MDTLYKSKQGKYQILRLYDEKLNGLNLEYKVRNIDTHFGKTSVIIAGDESKPPIIVIHGSNGCAPIALETYYDLKDSFCIYAVDVLAQPNKSAETRLSMKDDSYGRWLNEVIDILTLKNVTLAGFSFGGLVILKTLIHNEQNIKEVFLSSPAYIVNGNPIKALIKFFIPLKRYMRTNKNKYIDQFLKNSFTQKDKFAHKYLSLVFTYFIMDFTPVPIIKKEEALKLKTPITIFAADKDIVFPGTKMIRRANKIFPSLKHTLLLTESKHVQNRKDNSRIAQIIIENSTKP